MGKYSHSDLAQIQSAMYRKDLKEVERICDSGLIRSVSYDAMVCALRMSAQDKDFRFVEAMAKVHEIPTVEMLGGNKIKLVFNSHVHVKPFDDSLTTTTKDYDTFISQVNKLRRKQKIEKLNG